MSRFRKFTRSLFSGYVLLGANVLFTLASVPLALGYLSKAEFGLWALATQLAGYLALIDFGISGVSRILIDHKDDKQAGEYGGLIQTFVLVSAAQGALILLGGLGLAAGMGGWLKIPPELEQKFFWLTFGQCALLALSFLTRIFHFLLAAHQRNDVSNCAQAAAFMVSLGVLWLGFARGAGVYSLLWAQACGWLLSVVPNFIGCRSLGLFAPVGHCGRPTWVRFVELFRYGADIFFFTLGSLLVNASQTVLLTRVLGLETAAIWAVCTRVFALLAQVIGRVFDFSCPALAEMIVRGERSRLRQRFQSIVTLSASLSVVAGVLLVLGNQPFVNWWTHGRIGWEPWNDALLAAWLFVGAVNRSHLGLVGQVKAFGFLRWLCFIEGLCCVGLSLLVLRGGGVTALLAVAVAGEFLFSLPYGIWRTSEYFQIPWRTVAWEWMRPCARLAAWMLPLGGLAGGLGVMLPPVVQLPALAFGVVPLGAVLLFRFGLEAALQAEFVRRAPRRLHPLLRRLAGGSA